MGDGELAVARGKTGGLHKGCSRAPKPRPGGSASGERWRAGVPTGADGVAEFHDGDGQCLEVSHRLRVGELTVLEVAGLQVDRPRQGMRTEPGKYRAELGVDAEVVVVSGTHDHEAAHFALQPLYRDVVQKVLESARERGPEHRGGDQVHVGLDHSLHHDLGVVVVLREWATVGEGHTVVAQVQRLYRRRIPPCQTPC